MKKKGSIGRKLRWAIVGTGLGVSLLLFLLIFAQIVRVTNSISEDIFSHASDTFDDEEELLGELEGEEADNYADICTGFLNEHFEDVRKQVQSTALFMEGNPTEPEIRAYLENMPEFETDRPDALSVYVVPQRGGVISTQGAEEDALTDIRLLHKTKWYRKEKKHRKPYFWSNVQVGVLSDVEKVVCAIPYNDAEGQFVGVVAGAIELSSIPDGIREVDNKESISFVLFDRKNRLMYATGSFEDADFAASLFGEKDFAIKDGSSYSLKRLTETGWTLCVVAKQTKQEKIIESVLSDIVDYVLDQEETIRGRLVWTLIYCTVYLIFGIGVMCWVAHRLSNSLTHPIKQMTEQVEKIGSGDLSIQVDVKTNDEIGQLGEAFNKMTAELRDRLAHIQTINADKERMATERNFVRQIQWNMMPNVFPAFPDRKDFDVYASLLPTDEGGGSFYDFFFIDSETFCIAVGEAAGTGILSTLFAIVAKTNIKSYAQQGYSPDRILAETNNQLAYGNDEGIVADIFVGIINLSTGEADYARGGEAPVRWKHSGEEAIPLPGESGVTLGNMENVPYKRHRVRLSQGDLLFAHTKDSTECTDAHGNVYTEEYLYEKWGEYAAQEYRLTQLVEALNDDIKAYTDGTARKEDVTMLMFRYWGWR